MVTLSYTLIALWLGLALGPVISVADAQEWPPSFYSAKEIRATMVDAETGQPLDGVIVVAQWVLFVATPGHGGHGPRLHVAEAVSNAGGKLHIPGWGPKPNPRYPFTSLLDRDPILSFFKPGYRLLTVQNQWERNESVRFSEWDGKTIKLEKFKGADEEWARELRFLQDSLNWRSRDTDWRLMPRIILALELERLRLAQKRVGGRGGFALSDLTSLGTTIEEVRNFLEMQK